MVVQPTEPSAGDVATTKPTLKTPGDVITLLERRESYEDTWTHCSVTTTTGTAFHSEKVIMGVDEAGRGPVLGPMVYAVGFVPESKLKEVKSLGVDDSKKLQNHFRETLFSHMNTQHSEWVGWAVTAISEDIKRRYITFQGEIQLNQQAHETTVALVKHVQSMGISISEMYVDTVGKESKYQEYLEKQLPGIKITVSKKADSKYPIVSAASVFAKSGKISREFGSGYPGDPRTIKWLRDSMHPVLGYPSVRLDKNAVTVIWAGEDNESNKKGAKGKKQEKLFKDSPAVVDELSEEEEEEKDEDAVMMEADAIPVEEPKGSRKRKADDALEVIVKPAKELALDAGRDSFVKAIGMRHVLALF
ncbi:ribonuclease HII-domain-containing protein [Chytridium lagenaria]|nr:ribonuclease HII-domain-containing protein [Chytridium lagenaria]